MTGAERIAAERQRQIDRWGADHDFYHQNSELVTAALAYAQVALYGGAKTVPANLWPPNWSAETWKPSSDHIRNLEKAGALIAAEIDRLAALGGAPEGKTK